MGQGMATIVEPCLFGTKRVCHAKNTHNIMSNWSIRLITGNFQGRKHMLSVTKQENFCGVYLGPIIPAATRLNGGQELLNCESVL